MQQRILVTLILLVFGLITGQALHNPKEIAEIIAALPSPTPDDGRFLVAKVIDGDTIELDTGEKVRYIGVNTPETVDPHRDPQCFGKEASDYNTALVQGHRVELVADTSNTDKYGRLLRYVYKEDGTFVNERLIRDGYAYALAYPPDTAHKADFVVAQRQAQATSRGLWAACSTHLKHDK